jgi:hypothetical protein
MARGSDARADLPLARLRSVEIQPMICIFEPAEHACCLDDNCSYSCPPIWSAPRRVLISPGVRIQENLQVWSDHAP